MIERLFGVSPDAGTGSLELLYATLALLAVGAVAGRERIGALLRGLVRAVRVKRG